jgi:pimeloyl-ACP methyl ester carboxylesterase
MRRETYPPIGRLWHRDRVNGYEQVNQPLADGRVLEVFIGGAEDGIPIIFHSGTPSSGHPYQPFLELAAERGVRLVTYSRAGYAGSMRDPGRSVGDIAGDIAAVLDNLGASRCYTMGWSGGGPHALACAALIPERVIAATSIAGVAPYPAEGLDWMAGMGAENQAEFGAGLESPEALQRFLEHEGSWVATVTADEVAAGFGDLVSDTDKSAITGDFAEWLAVGFRESARNGIWGWFDDDLAFLKPWGFEVQAIDRPVAIWQGAQDRMVPFAHGQWLAQHVGSATARLLPEHGHLSLAVASMGRILDELLATPA